MTMDKMIEQAAREYADVANPYLLGEEIELVRNAFEAGAEWVLANQWHDVSKGDLPKSPKGDECNLSFVVMYKDGTKCFAYYDYYEMGTYSFYDNFGFAIDVAYWCEIPPFESKQSKR